MSDEPNPETPTQPAPAPRMSADVGAIAAALAKAQGEIRNPPKSKTARLKLRSGKEMSYDYADIADCIDGIRAALSGAEIAYIQDVTTDRGTLTVETLLVHSSGQWMRLGRLTCGADTDDPQKIGAAITYLRRYSLAASVGIAPDADTDSRGHEPPQRQPQRQQRPPVQRKASPPKQQAGAPTVASLQSDLKALWTARGIDTGSAEGRAAVTQTIADRFDGATIEDIWSNGEALADLLSVYGSDTKEQS